ncbi:hypothetical protein ES703_96129 [subsurface metagenome]
MKSLYFVYAKTHDLYVDFMENVVLLVHHSIMKGGLKMTVAEATKTLSDLRDEKGIDLSIQECNAIGIALVVMCALEPSQVDLIDHIIAMTDNPQN